MYKILIIENSPDSMNICSCFPCRETYEVDCVLFEDGLRILSEHHHSILITDLDMEDARGKELISCTLELHPPVDIILVTDHVDIESAILAVKAGISDYLVKPVDVGKLVYAVEQCLKQRKLKDENEELKNLLNLFQTSQEIAASLDLGRVQQLLTDGLACEYGVSRALGLFQVDGGLEPVILKGIPQAFASEFRDIVLSHVTRNLSASCLMKQIKLDTGHTSLEIQKMGITEICAIFIRTGETLQGIVALFNDKGQLLPTVNTKKRNILFLLQQLERVYENAEAYGAAKSMLFIDDLTGLFNHRYLDVALDRELKRVERYKTKLAVLFMDLDSFKTINDTYGHLTGSRILTEMGMLLKRSVREVDIVIRYGGDEYTILLIETTPETAIAVAERIRKNIESHAFLAEEDLDIHITCSIGIACCPEDTVSRVELLEMADKAMYTSKAGGRNTVNCYAKT